MPSKLQKLKDEVLKYLFKGYQDARTHLFDIAEIANKYGEDPHEVGEFLLSKGWVKRQQFRSPASFYCQITLSGIDQVAPEYYENHKNGVISALGGSGDKMSVMGILGFESKDHQKALDIVERLESSGYIEEGQYDPDDIFIKLSFKGRDYYDENSAKFF